MTAWSCRGPLDRPPACSAGHCWARARRFCRLGMLMTAKPAPEQLPSIRLKIARRSSHPWVYQKMVERPATRLPPGSVVDILDRDSQWVGRGFYNGHSRIALRVLSTNPEEAIDDTFFANRIARAVALRRDWLRLDEISD